VAELTDKLRSFLGERRYAVLATHDPDGDIRRVRVPSLPSLEVPANRQVALSVQTRFLGFVAHSWPNADHQKCLQIWHFSREIVSGRTK
jgi:hypothetical protein